MSRTALRVIYRGKVVGDNRRLRINRNSHRPAYPDPGYAAFKLALGWAVKEGMGWGPPRPYPLRGQVELEARCCIHPKMDPANLLKPIQDVLQNVGVVLDDNQFLRSAAVRAGRCRGGRDCWLELRVWEV